MNKVILMGRLTSDPDIQYYGEDDKGTIARFTIAVNYNEDDTDFIRCVAFNATAELAEKYLHKASKILVEGRWHTGNYENDDGETVYTNECILNRFEFCESKGSEEANKSDKTNKSGKTNKSKGRSR